MTKVSLCLIYIAYLLPTDLILASVTVQLYSLMWSARKRVCTSNDVVRLLNNLDSDLKSDFDFENSSDCSCSSDNTEAETEEDSDVVDDVSWSSIPVSTMQSLDFTRKSAMNITLHIRATFDDRHFEHSCAGDKSESCTT